MTTEQLKRANEIQKEIDIILTHKGKVLQDKITLCWNEAGYSSGSFPAVKKFAPMTDILFKQIYLDNLENHIKKLQNEMEAL